MGPHAPDPIVSALCRITGATALACVVVLGLAWLVGHCG